MNRMKKNKKILIVSLIVIILTLIVLSNAAKALVGLKQIDTTGELSEFAAKDAEGFVYDATPGEIFTLNARNNKRGISVDGGDVYYKSTICIFHSQATRDNTKVMLTNVIDIEAPGNVIVYRYKSIEDCTSGEVGTITENGNTITEITSIRQNGADKKYKVTYTKTVLDLSNAEREDFEKVAYLMDKAMDYKIDPEDKIQNSYAEATIDWFWKDRIKDYIADRGVLDPYFDIDTYIGKDRPSFIQSEVNEATTAANQIQKVSLAKGETEPEIYYGDNGKAYIGPLQVNYTGGTTTIKVHGNSGEVVANWTTKNKDDETFNDEETGNIESGQIFYAVVDEAEIEGIDNVNVKVYLNYTKAYKTRFALANNKTQGGQNLMFFAGNKDGEEEQDEVSWTIENAEPKYGNLIIEKKGENGSILQGVEFTLWKAVSEDTGYLRLSQNSEFISKIDKEININDYEVEYVGINEIEKATKFVTNAEGKVIVKNLEYSKGSLDYNYWVGEEKNDHYGYKGMTMTIEDVTIDGGTVGEVQEDADIEFVINKDSTEILLTVQNNPELAPLEILKVGEDGTTPLVNVKLKVEIGAGEYLQLQDSNGAVKSVEGTVTINKNNVATDSEYAVKYITDKSEATEFITDAYGKVTINNLEVNASKSKKYTYTAHETYNPNFGYGSKENISIKEKIEVLKLNETNQIKISNKQHLGDLELKKYDEDNHSIILPNVGFAIELTPGLEKAYAYMALYDEAGRFQPTVEGTVTINSKNKAQNATTGKEYEVRYYYSDKGYSELSDEEKANITSFLTGDDGILIVKNIEVYSPKTGEKYSYKLIETSNPNYGYVVDTVELGDIPLEDGETTKRELGNPPVYIKLSGYVWIENSSGKSNEYDCVFTNTDKDVKLTDLYKVENGELVKNPDAGTPVEIKLRDKNTGEIIEDKPHEFDENGKYTFVDVEIEKLANYEVVFVYDGFYYTTTIPHLDKDNGSKVKEVEADRTKLNNQFGVVKYNDEIISADRKTTNTLEYSKDGHTSTVSKFNFDTTIQANTNETGINLKDEYNKLKANATTILETIDNINMGLVLREQPMLGIGSDINSVEVEVNGYNYTYYYNGRQDHYQNVNDDEVGVKFEEEQGKYRYSHNTIYSSDLEALENGSATMNVSLIYKISISNNAKTLNSIVYEIENYFDADYTINSIGLSLNENNEITDKLDNNMWKIAEGIQVEYGEGVVAEEGKKYNSVRIMLGENGIALQNGETKSIYIEFNISQSAIKGLLEGKSTYHNATEIMSYSTYYGETTGKGEIHNENGELEIIYVVTEQGAEGEIYAGVDKASRPGNIKLELVKDSREQGETPILNIMNFEMDETAAPSLILEPTEERGITGVVWEDLATEQSKAVNEKLGDGKYKKDEEKVIKNVLVALREVKENGSIGDIVKYSDNETLAITETNENGEYTLGYYDEEKDEYVGILPGKYIIEYTYGKYAINDEEKESYIVEKEAIDVMDYKSTIIVSENIKNAFETSENDRWFVKENDARYSDVRDDVTLRAEYDVSINPDLTVTNSTYLNILKINKMNAHTPVMDIGIQFTEADEADALTTEFKSKLENVDCGIIERPVIDITIEKEVTGFEVIAQTGTSIIPMGNPSDLNSKMQYVKKLDGLVSAEIESKLLQSATLNLEYTITVKNNSNIDYYELEYYYYGTGGVTKAESKPKLVVDYLDNTMEIDSDKNQEGIWNVVTKNDLQTQGLVDANVTQELETDKYHILTTNAFAEVGSGQENQVKLYAQKQLAISDSIREENKVEIIELTGKRTIKEAIPGNYVPSTAPTEPDEDEVDVTVTPPTGLTVNYTLYIVATIITLIILGIGIVIIKKRVIK